MSRLLAAFQLLQQVCSAEGKTFGPDPQLYQKTVDRAIQFLAAQQSEDGSLSPQIGIGPTALATLGLLRSGRTVADPQVAKGLKYLEEYVQESGGIHMPGGRIPIYETCIALICFKEANRDGRYDKIIQGRREVHSRWPVGRKQGQGQVGPVLRRRGLRRQVAARPVEHRLPDRRPEGVRRRPDDPAIQKALVFVSRCQNLESEHNTTKFAAKVNDGGFYYTPVLSKQEEERQTPDGGLRSYGSMTYSGLKSMIYAGLTKDDPRVKAAVQWIRKNYDVKSNPGMGEAGLYYYYHTFAKALDAFGDRRDRGRQGGEARLAAGIDRGTRPAAERERLLGQYRQQMDGRRPQPGDGLRPAGAVLLPAARIEIGSRFH